jgi:hypothetical protein
MRVIFLDFDGVIVWWGYNPKPGGILQPDPGKVRMLNSIVDATGAVVVVSSSWRVGRSRTDLAEILNDAGFRGRVRDVTPDGHLLPSGLYSSYPRSEEIRTWLRRRARAALLPVESFVVIDDEDMREAFGERMVLIENGMSRGIQPHHVEQAIRQLQIPLDRVD